MSSLVFNRLPTRPRSRRHTAASRVAVAIATAAMAAGGAQSARAQCSLTNTLSGLTPTSAGAGGYVDSGTFTDPTTGATTTIGAIDPTLPIPQTPPAGGDAAVLPTPPIPPDPSTDPATGLDLNVVGGDGTEDNIMGPGTSLSGAAETTPDNGAGNNVGVTDSIDPTQTLTTDTPLTISPADAGANPVFPNYATPANSDPVEDPQAPPVNSGPRQDQAVLPTSATTAPGYGG